MRSEVHELICKYINMAQSVDELMQDKQNKERSRAEKKNQEERQRYTSQRTADCIFVNIDNGFASMMNHTAAVRVANIQLVRRCRKTSFLL